MDISNVKMGILNSYFPPFEGSIRNTKNYEEAGYDSLWLPDHIMNWFPDAIWSPDIVNVASVLKRPHDLYNIFPVMAVMANNTKKVK